MADQHDTSTAGKKRKRDVDAGDVVPEDSIAEEDPTDTETGGPPTKQRKKNGGIFGRGIPPRNLRFPSFGNITAVEICTFLPEWLRSKDIVNRLIQNGFTTDELTKIVNHHRQSPKTHSAMNNTMCHVLQKPMTECGFEGWTVQKHQKGTYDAKNPNWDPDNLSLNGMHVQSEIPGHSGKYGNGNALNNVSFTKLAVGVQNLPDATTGDALDLTRCVAFAVQNAHLDLQFPRDFEQVARHLGLAVVRAEHYDRTAAARWRAKPKPKPVQTPDQGKLTRAKKGGAGKVTAKDRHHAVIKGATKDVIASKPAPLEVQKKKAPPQPTSQQHDDAELMDFHEGGIQEQRLDDPLADGSDSVAQLQHVHAGMAHYVDGGLDIQFDMPPYGWGMAPHVYGGLDIQFDMPPHGWGMDVETHDDQTPVAAHNMYNADYPAYDFNEYPGLPQASFGSSPEGYEPVPPMDPALSDPWVLQQLEAIDRFDHSKYNPCLHQTEPMNISDYPPPDENALGNDIDAYLESLYQMQVAWP
tara:strand:+ start:1677 stop:3251 length:1575 start_codon:yes stop_codon:yes gene_type:complete